jgi:hypothetical protein
MRPHTILAVKSALSLVGILFLLTWPILGAAQAVKSTFVGTVRDASGAVVPGAKIVVTNLDTEVSSSLTTNNAGDYTVPFLNSGRYSLTAAATGFQTSVENEVKLDVAATVRVDFSLKVGSSSQEVQVIGATPLLETDTSNVGMDVPAERLQQLPLQSRDFQQLAELAPTAVQPESFTANTAYVPGITAGNYYQAGGQRGSSEFYTLDGLDNNNIAWQTIALLPSLDTISEFKFQTHNFSAEYGRGTTQFTAVTKQGTSQLHGSAYEYLRNAALNANSYFNNRAHARKSPFTYNQFGVTVGGPIVIPRFYSSARKSFFFFGYEGTRYTTGGATFANWPNPTWLTGDFSSLGQTIYDPATTRPDPNNPGGYIRTPFPGNVIPASRFDPVAVASIPYVPKPGNVTTVAGENTAVNTHTVSAPNNFVVRLDQTITQKDSLYGTWRQSNEYETIAGIAPLSGTIGIHNAYSAMAAETHVFTPRLINEIRAGWLNSSLGSYQEGGTGGCVGSCPANTNLTALFGLKNLIGSVDPSLYGMPNFSWTGYSAMGGGANNPLASLIKTLQISDNVSLSRGKHMFKMGVNWANENFTYTSQTYARGGLNYNGQFTAGTQPGQTASGSPWSDYLLGLNASAFGLAGTISGPRHAGYQGYYFQDDWRIASKLTLNLGLRWEYFNPFTATIDGNNAQFNLGRAPGSCFGSACPAGFIQTFGKGQAVYKSNWNDWGPRLGFSYSPFAKTVVRGGGGIFFTATDSTDSNMFGLFNPPVSLSYTETPTNQFTDLTTTKASNLFPATGIIPPVSQLTTANWPLPAITVYSDIIGWSPDPSVQEWNLSVQQEVWNNLLVEVGYMGSHGIHNSMDINYNQARLDSPGVTTSIASRMPYPSLSSTMINCVHAAISTYNAGYLRVERRLSGGLSFISAYTWAKTMSNYSNKNDTGNFWPQNSYDPKGNYGLAAFDARQRFSTGYVWQLPVGRDRRWGGGMNTLTDLAVGGWQVSGITVFQTGNPLYPLDASDQSNTGMFTGIRPNQVAPVHYLDIRKTGMRFDPSAFQYQTFGTFGNAPNGALTAPGFDNWDIGIDKRFRVTERASVQFRTEMFNAFNHAQFVKSSVSISPTLTPTQEAGVSSTQPPRNIEFSLRVEF